MTVPSDPLARVWVNEREDGTGKISRQRTSFLVCPEFAGFELYSLADVKTQAGL